MMKYLFNYLQQPSGRIGYKIYNFKDKPIKERLRFLIDLWRIK